MKSTSVYDGENAAEEANRLIDENDQLRAQLAQARGELAAMREALEQVDKILAIENLPHAHYNKVVAIGMARRNFRLGPRAAQLGRLIEAAGEWMKCRDSWLESSNSDYDRTEAEYEVSKDKLATAYRAAFPPEQTP